MKRPAITLVLCAAFLNVVGCATSGYDSSATASDSARNPSEAERRTREALTLIDRNPAKAEQLLREALDADSFYGPAHNNLGVLYLRRGDLAPAAQEFSSAQRLIPGHPDPRLNLALTLEAAGRVDEALEEYRSALEISPDHIQTLQAMVRCMLRRPRPGFGDESEITEHLRDIAMRGETEEWREWAQRQLQIRSP